jgi:hypothetical protein
MPPLLDGRESLTHRRHDPNDFHRQMEGATGVYCSGSASVLIKNIENAR